MRPWFTVILLVCVAAGCEGRIGALPGDFDADPARSGGPAGDPSSPSIDPSEPLFTYASVGSRCVDGSLSEWLVLSQDPVDCMRHADFTQSSSDGFVRVPLPSEPGGLHSAVVSFCAPGGGCTEREIQVDVSSFAPGEGLQGNWSVDLGAPQVVGGPIDAVPCTYEPPDNPARAIRVSNVLITQGVAIPLSQSQAPTPVSSRNAPVVAGRDAVFQIEVATEENWVPRDLIAQVQIGSEVAGETRVQVQGPSNASDPAGLISVPVEGERIGQGGSYSVGLFELTACVDQPGEVLEPQFPSSGSAQLGAESVGGPFRLVLVPVRWNTDGSGRLPDLSPSVVEDFANRAEVLYPVSGVEVSVRNEPLDYGGDLDAAGNGWTELLSDCLNLRASDNGPSEEYYYCLFQPTESVQEFCAGGCVAGIGPVPGATDTFRRAAIGIGFDGSGVGTFVHEIGHALGRPHAPCGGADGADPNYPYGDAAIGVWGYDLIQEEHIPPDHRDLMSYCGPNWISDYNYGLLFDRIASVYGPATLKSRVSTEPTQYQTVVVNADVSLSWGSPVTLHAEPEGEPLQAELLGPSGQVIARISATYQAVTHIPGGMILFEDNGAAYDAVRIEGFGALPN